MKNYLRALLPSVATAFSFLILPAVLTVYFVFTQYSDRFIVDQSISYLDVQNNWLGTFFLSQQWIAWFNRFMDFAFWGVLAIIGLLIMWAVSSSRTAIENHTIQQGFRNFQIDRSQWHGHFILVAILKIITIVLAIYCVIALIGTAVPRLSLDISLLVHGAENANILACAKSFFYIFGLQYVGVTAIKLFSHLSAD